MGRVCTISFRLSFFFFNLLEASNIGRAMPTVVPAHHVVAGASIALAGAVIILDHISKEKHAWPWGVSAGICPGAGSWCWAQLSASFGSCSTAHSVTMQKNKK